jgi:hypothetical protein
MITIQMEKVLENRKERLIREHLLMSEFIGFAVTTPIAEILNWNGQVNFPFINSTGVIFSNVANFLRPEDFRTFKGEEDNILGSRINIAHERLRLHLQRVEKRGAPLIGKSEEVIETLPRPIPLRTNAVNLRKFPLDQYDEFRINWCESDGNILGITPTYARHRNPEFWIPLHDYVPDRESRFTYAFTGSKALTHWFVQWFGKENSIIDSSTKGE